MSNAQSALSGVHYSGIANVTELDLAGMITLRGDLTRPKMKAAVKTAAGVGMPKPNTIEMTDGAGAAWMSPDELLLLVPYPEVSDRLGRATDTLGNEHSLAVDVSDARALFSVSGPRAREVMAKLAPVDLSKEAFHPGMFRRTRMAQVPAAFWMADEATFHIICFRSVAQYVFDLLCVAAQVGSDVGVL